jgi:hypothetical protein
VVLSVSDTGVGIPMADQVRVFEKFERGDPTLTRRGAGLGLSLVKSLVELHGGRVTIESSPDRGTIVRCHLSAGRARSRYGPLGNRHYRYGALKAAGHTLCRRIFEMQRLAGMDQRVDRVRRQRGLG